MIGQMAFIEMVSSRRDRSTPGITPSDFYFLARHGVFRDVSVEPMSNRRIKAEAAREGERRESLFRDLERIGLGFPKGSDDYNELRRLGLARREWHGMPWGWRWVLTAKGIGTLQAPKASV